MARVLFCLGEDEAEDLEGYHELVEPDLREGGHEVSWTTQAEVFEQLASTQPDYLILVALNRHSSGWDIARRLRGTRERGDPYILVITGSDIEGSPDNPFYYVLPEYQQLYDCYWPREGFTEWLEFFQEYGPITWGRDEQKRWQLQRQS
jgi:hypothetical protein